MAALQAPVPRDNPGQGPQDPYNPAPATPGAPGIGVPAGGATGDVLTKNSATDFDTKWATPAAGSGTGLLMGGRLTGVSGSPASPNDTLLIANLYWSPYISNIVTLWDGAAWVSKTSAEITLNLAAAGTAGLPYDVFMYLSAGVPALEILGWSTASARATALVLTDGRYTKSGDKTRLYLGTFHTTTAALTEDSAVNRLVWNYYNRVKKNLRYRSTSGHSYNGGYRPWNNLLGTSRVQFVIGVSEDSVRADVVGENGAGAGVYAITGLQLDGSTTPDTYAYSNGVAAFASASGYDYMPAVGFHFLEALESSASSGSATFVTLLITGSLQA